MINMISIVLFRRLRMIRVLNETDTKAFYELTCEAFHLHPFAFVHEINERSNYTERDIAQVLHPKNHHLQIFFGAFDDDTLVGFVQLNFFPYSSKSHKATVQGLYVKPEYRGQQIGRALMETLIAYAHQKGIEQLVLAVASNNIAAKVFCDHLGFEFLALEIHARKFNNKYVDEHWLVYYFDKEYV
ncbi:N-acetyltransferase [Staphylococcus agnetis]|uniref:GNAT family N-acetyltransferase n=2 Tax=Staphylococcus TaxID=1279 RepID=A0A242VGZ7_9STAP|nr:GNAT family N-acetyltransferase [Staphylococcus agnetis]NJH83971.1 GNAT family N-acetyltransferase [Staphylococcus agnetis]NJH86745.1 GNAT family N-acetyltransferase [Staphylococcus agnetis]NJI02834.1 GNAT family N-acetyltransferase [Staphylococcus agnetis]NJI13455.1 GNAT family N-acetyltransferase [Staphylococcus agnetis]